MDLDFSNPWVIGGIVVAALLVTLGVVLIVRVFHKFRAPVFVALFIGLVVGGITAWQLKPPDYCPVLMPQAPIVPPLEEPSRLPEANTPDTLQQTEPPAQ